MTAARFVPPRWLARRRCSCCGSRPASSAAKGRWDAAAQGRLEAGAAGFPLLYGGRAEPASVQQLLQRQGLAEPQPCLEAGWAKGTGWGQAGRPRARQRARPGGDLSTGTTMTENEGS